MMAPIHATEDPGHGVQGQQEKQNCPIVVHGKTRRMPFLHIPKEVLLMPTFSGVRRTSSLKVRVRCKQAGSCSIFPWTTMGQ